MNRLSSNWTLFWKIFVPVFYVAFFGLLAGLMMAFGIEELGPLGLPSFKLVYLATFFCMLILFWFTIIRIKRVEIQEDQLFITDYFKSIRVDQRAITQIKRINILIFNVVFMKFSTKTRFGSSLFFLEEPVAHNHITTMIEASRASQN